MASLLHPPDSYSVRHFELKIDIYKYTENNNTHLLWVSSSPHKTLLCFRKKIILVKSWTTLNLGSEYERLKLDHTHLYSSQVWLPKKTLTVLPAPRFSPTIVTLVPPDSGPLPGVSTSIEGVCGEPSFINALFNTGQTQNTGCCDNCPILKSVVKTTLAEWATVEAATIPTNDSNVKIWGQKRVFEFKRIGV